MLNVQLSIEHSSEMRETLHEERAFAVNRNKYRRLGLLQKVPLRHVPWPIQQQLGALKRVGSRFPFRLVAFRRILVVQAAVKMAEPRNRKLAQPFTILGLAGDQDNFLAFGIAGFCHGCLRLDHDAEKQLGFSCLFGLFGLFG